MADAAPTASIVSNNADNGRRHENETWQLFDMGRRTLPSVAELRPQRPLDDPAEFIGQPTCSRPRQAGNPQDRANHTGLPPAAHLCIFLAS